VLTRKFPGKEGLAWAPKGNEIQYLLLQTPGPAVARRAQLPAPTSEREDCQALIKISGVKKPDGRSGLFVLRPGSVNQLRDECRNYWQPVNANALAGELVPAVTETAGVCMCDCAQSDTPGEPGTNAFASTV